LWRAGIQVKVKTQSYRPEFAVQNEKVLFCAEEVGATSSEVFLLTNNMIYLSFSAAFQPCAIDLKTVD